MNWIEIDKMIVQLLSSGNPKDKVKADLKKMFKWNDVQADSAVDPIAKRMPEPVLQESNKPKSKPRKPRKKLTSTAK